jgi:hypothetical protein
VTQNAENSNSWRGDGFSKRGIGDAGSEPTDAVHTGHLIPVPHPVVAAAEIKSSREPFSDVGLSNESRMPTQKTNSRMCAD